MHTVVYDGSFEGWLSAVFDVYEYKLNDVRLCHREAFNGSIFGQAHEVSTDSTKSQRVLKGLETRLSDSAVKAVYRCFLSENSDELLLRYVQYIFSTKQSVENDYSHPAVLGVVQTARKVWREKHRMEAFVRFHKTGDGLFYAMIEPDYNVLPLIVKHFETRYADQRWMIYDGRRKSGIYYDGHTTEFVEVTFSEEVKADESVAYTEDEEIYQELWKRYFSSVNIAARKNTKLHLQHMPRRYWKYLVEKQPSSGRPLPKR